MLLSLAHILPTFSSMYHIGCFGWNKQFNSGLTTYIFTSKETQMWVSESYFSDRQISSQTLKVCCWLLLSFDSKLATTTQNITSCMKVSPSQRWGQNKEALLEFLMLIRKKNQEPFMYFSWFLMDVLNHMNIPRPIENRIDGITNWFRVTMI